MRRLEVKASRSYEVLIGEGILEEAGARLKEVASPKKTAIITDDRVRELYGDIVEKSLRDAGFETENYVFKNGEASKTMETLWDILEFLAKKGLTMSDMVIALGGGVPGDVAGFAAASYQRGIKFMQIPTTFLAAIDSSVGGKTGVDLKAGKNLAGAFWQPSLVLCDHRTLDTLPDVTFSDGVAEGIKYGILSSESLFESFETGGFRENMEETIFECVSIKKRLVAEDERDNGRRQLLNLGHTFGHAIEKLSSFEITHGHAVAAGTAIAARVAKKLGLTGDGEVLRIRECLEKNNLPTGTDMELKDIAEAALSDKKRRGDRITLILPEAIGSCRLYPVDKSELPGLLEGCLR